MESGAMTPSFQGPPGGYSMAPPPSMGPPMHHMGTIGAQDFQSGPMRPGTYEIDGPGGAPMTSRPMPMQPPMQTMPQSMPMPPMQSMPQQMPMPQYEEPQKPQQMPMQTMPQSMPQQMPMPPPSMPMLPGPQASMPMPAPSMPQDSQWISNVARPEMKQVANPPVTAGNIQYGPSYSMQYQKRSAADKTAVKYTGFLPLEGVYEEDTCRIG